MNVPFYLVCAGFGLVTACAVGPVFVLVFNRAVQRGWAAGFATGVGSAVGDAVYFYLGLLGLLQGLVRYPRLIQMLYLVGGLALSAMSIHLLLARPIKVRDLASEDSHLAFATQSFVLTLANPSVLLFIMVMSARILGWQARALSYTDIVIGTVVLALSAMSMTAVISMLAAAVGSCLGERHLQWLSRFSGVIAAVSAIYLLLSSIGRAS